MDGQTAADGSVVERAQPADHRSPGRDGSPDRPAGQMAPGAGGPRRRRRRPRPFSSRSPISSRGSPPRRRNCKRSSPSRSTSRVAWPRRPPGAAPSWRRSRRPRGRRWEDCWCGTAGRSGAPRGGRRDAPSVRGRVRDALASRWDALVQYARDPSQGWPLHVGKFSHIGGRILRGAASGVRLDRGGATGVVRRRGARASLFRRR
ncbi:MAG: hypothetical protein MZV64_73735 [Ignavibacteriales bacterium]|nr:hypothetical protein [Ignavibacteriales bacterium]